MASGFRMLYDSRGFKILEASGFWRLQDSGGFKIQKAPEDPRILKTSVILEFPKILKILIFQVPSPDHCGSGAQLNQFPQKYQWAINFEF